MAKNVINIGPFKNIVNVHWGEPEYLLARFGLRTALKSPDDLNSVVQETEQTIKYWMGYPFEVRPFTDANGNTSDSNYYLPDPYLVSTHINDSGWSPVPAFYKIGNNFQYGGFATSDLGYYAKHYYNKVGIYNDIIFLSPYDYNNYVDQNIPIGCYLYEIKQNIIQPVNPNLFLEPTPILNLREEYGFQAPISDSYFGYDAKKGLGFFNPIFKSTNFNNEFPNVNTNSLKTQINNFIRVPDYDSGDIITNPKLLWSGDLTSLSFELVGSTPVGDLEIFHVDETKTGFINLLEPKQFLRHETLNFGFWVNAYDYEKKAEHTFNIDKYFNTKRIINNKEKNVVYEIIDVAVQTFDLIDPILPGRNRNNVLIDDCITILMKPISSTDVKK